MNSDSDYHARWESWYYEALDRDFWNDLCARLDAEEAAQNGWNYTDDEFAEIDRAYEEYERDLREGNIP